MTTPAVHIAPVSPVVRTIRHALLTRQSLVLCALIALTAALIGLSRLTLPRRLAGAESLPAALQGFTHQAAGYVRIPADGAYALTVFFAGNARLFVDGVPADTCTACTCSSRQPELPHGRLSWPGAADVSLRPFRPRHCRRARCRRSRGAPAMC
jgi:hypothetical protein